MIPRAVHTRNRPMRSKGPHVTSINGRSELVSLISGNNTFACPFLGAINPGLATVFPWLSKIAGAYEMYHFRNLRFEFKSTSSVFNGATPTLGRVTMVTEYDELKGAFTSMRESENYEGATMFMPFENRTHTVDVRGRRLGAVLNFKTRYIRTGDLSTFNAFGGTADPHAYDVGLFHLCVQGTVPDQIGELWVHYSVDLIKPRVDFVNGNVFAMQNNHAPTAADHGIDWFQSDPLSGYIFANINNNITMKPYFDLATETNSFTCTGVPVDSVITIVTKCSRSAGTGVMDTITLSLGDGLQSLTDNKLLNGWSALNSDASAGYATVRARVVSSTFVINVAAGVTGASATMITMLVVEQTNWLDPDTAYPPTLEDYISNLSSKFLHTRIASSQRGESSVSSSLSVSKPRPSLSSDFEEVKIGEVPKTA